jgi:hypothetical protein
MDPEAVSGAVYYREQARRLREQAALDLTGKFRIDLLALADDYDREAEAAEREKS